MGCSLPGKWVLHWGGNYVGDTGRNLAGEISQEYAKCQAEDALTKNLMELVVQIVAFHMKVRRQIQMIFLQMGFEEMPTNNFVESSFWNFDALFQPQHPARDSHDTFFLKEPSTTRSLPEDYVKRVKRVKHL